MTLQNRVDPKGNLHAVPDRGTLMGNRGILHNDKKQIVRPWAQKSWITCSLTFQNEKRKLFSQGSYSELFFLDEATSFAAGHRPCWQCQRDRYIPFKNGWMKANLSTPTPAAYSIKKIDDVLHTERVINNGEKQTFDALLADIPDGTIVEHGDQKYLRWKDRCHPWSFQGYGKAVDLPLTTNVKVLTPKSIVRLFASGFVPNVHFSVNN